MSIELTDFRGKITAETHAVLEAVSRTSGRDRSEIVREHMHVWAMEQIHAATVLQGLLRAQGLRGIDGGVSGSLRESKGVSGSSS
jgi:hypothetical protein